MNRQARFGDGSFRSAATSASKFEPGISDSPRGASRLAGAPVVEGALDQSETLRTLLSQMTAAQPSDEPAENDDDARR